MEGSEILEYAYLYEQYLIQIYIYSAQLYSMRIIIIDLSMNIVISKSIAQNFQNGKKVNQCFICPSFFHEVSLSLYPFDMIDSLFSRNPHRNNIPNIDAME